MKTGVSEQYRLLTPAEVEPFALQCADAWKDAEIPRRQYELVVSKELEAFRNGKPVLPYDVAVKCLRAIPGMENARLLDVGCASGYYSEVLRIAGFNFRYVGCDFSPALIDAAVQLFPQAHFQIADGTALPFDSGQFEVVLHSACLMHLKDWAPAIKEAARVSNRLVIFHRTAITKGETQFWAKEAYSVPCLEVHRNEAEFLNLCSDSGLKLIHIEPLFFEKLWNAGHFTYVLEKAS